MDVFELRIRIAACKAGIKILEEEAKGDPRQPAALKLYRGELQGLEDKLKEKLEEQQQPELQPQQQSSTPKPPPTVIGLKTAILTGKVPKKE